MTKRMFPIFSSHSAATCFNCSAALAGEPQLEVFAPGGGQYSNVCIGGCGMWTWYDLSVARDADHAIQPMRKIR